MTSTTGLTGLLSAPDASSDLVDQTGFDLYRILNTSTDPFSATINGTGEVFQSTGFDASTTPVVVDQLSGLGGWTASFQARYPRGTPKVGHEGLTTYAAGTVVKSTGWSLNFSCQPHPDTGQAIIPPKWMEFIPGQVSITGGSFDTAIDDAIAPTLNTSGPATFRTNIESGTDNTFSGNIIITGWAPAVAVGSGRNVMRYTFVVDGNMTSAGDKSLFAAGTLTTPDITEIVLRAGGDRKFTGLAFWTSLSIGASIGSPIEVSGSLQGTGELVVG